MIWIKNESTDPFYNLAFEEYVLKNVKTDEAVAMIWQNRPAVIIGRWQNTAEEINREYIEANGIDVVRRITGGGAVYHDLGNINYTYISPCDSDKFDFAGFVRPVTAALGELGLTAVQSGRNDITVNGAKVSGNAEFCHRGRLLHHGTMLYSADLSVVADTLRVKPDKFESKSVKSVRSRVANISDFLENPPDIETFKSLILASLTKEGAEEYVMGADELAAVRTLADAKYRTWEWVYGESPKFNAEKRRRFPVGSVELKMQVEDGVIKDCSVFGDFFTSGDPGEIARALCGARTEKSAILAALGGADISAAIPGVTADDIAEIVLY